jgi:glutathione S-transferase
LVIDAHLKKQGTLYLLGDEISYVDLAFIPWQRTYSTMLIPEWDFVAEAPVFAAWRERLDTRESTQKVFAMDMFQFPTQKS